MNNALAVRAPSIRNATSITRREFANERQVTFPARVLEAMGVRPGDRLRLEEGPDGFVLRPQTIDPARLAPLRGKLRRGCGSFDLTAFREQHHDPALRD